MTQPTRHASVAILSAGAAVLAAVCGLTLLATLEQHALPAIMQGNRYTPAMITVVSSVWVLSLLALRRQGSRPPQCAMVEHAVPHYRSRRRIVEHRHATGPHPRNSQPIWRPPPPR